MKTIPCTCFYPIINVILWHYVAMFHIFTDQCYSTIKNGTFVCLEGSTFDKFPRFKQLLKGVMFYDCVPMIVTSSTCSPTIIILHPLHFLLVRYTRYNEACDQLSCGLDVKIAPMYTGVSFRQTNQPSMMTGYYGLYLTIT